KQQPDRCKACMPSVEDPDLPRAVLIEVISVHDIQAGILAGQQLLNMRRPFNCEKVVWLCCHHQLVLKARLVPYFIDILFRESRHNPTHSRIGTWSRLIHPCEKSFLKIPEFDISDHQFFQRRSIPFNKLTRYKREGLVCCATKVQVPPIQQECELSGKRIWNGLRIGIFRVEGDTGLRSIGKYDRQIRVFRHSEEAVRFDARVHKSPYARDQSNLTVWLAVYKSVEAHMIQTFLIIEKGCTSSAKGLNALYIAVKGSPLVEDVDHPVSKGAKKIPATKLNHFYNSPRGDTSLVPVQRLARG